jgi:hypothetical protein
MASFRAHLSPNEETTLRRIALDVLESDDVREADAKRLTALGLVKVVDGLLIPTTKGLERLQIETSPPSQPEGRRRLKGRRLRL